MKIYVSNDPVGQKRKRYNKNKKKAWRRKIDLSDIDNAQDEINRQERFGGQLTERKSEDFFSLDFALCDDGKEEPSDSPEIKDERKKGILKCHFLLDGLPGVPAISKKKKRPAHRQRKPQKIHAAKMRFFKAKKMLAESGLSAENENDFKHALDLISAKNQKKKSSKPAKKRDLWSAEDKALADFDEVGKSFAVAGLTFNRKSTGRELVRAPSSVLHKPNKIAAVSVPEGGLSYNPSFQDHQKLLSKAIDKDNKEKEKRKRDLEAEKVLEKKYSKQVTEDRKMAELVEGLPFFDDKSLPTLKKSKRNEKLNSAAESGGFIPPRPQRKTEKQRKKEVRKGWAELKRKRSEQIKTKEEEVLKIDSINKELDKMKEKQIKTLKIRAQVRNINQYTTKRVSRHKFEDTPDPVILGSDITGSLRTTGPIRASLRSAFENVQKRNIIPPKGKPMKAIRKRKKVLKRAMKIGEKGKNQQFHN